MGYLSLPAGGMSTSARLKMLMDNQINFVFCTPTYALRMAETAAAEGIDLAGSSVRALIVAGEPGGSIPSVRNRIESAWGARLFDHCGMTEIGSVGYECQEAPGGMHVIESEFIPEVIDPKTGATLDDGQTGELVLTNLGRWGSPLIRYRTGDLVKLTRERCACGSCFARLEGGILSRVDDMFIVRGNNVFPTAVEAVLRQFPEVAEFRLCLRESESLTQVRLEIEPINGAVADDLANRVAHAVQAALSFRADVVAVPSGSLPRFEMKARRFIREDARKQS
jgi:phenylacetate-CoA ligase